MVSLVNVRVVPCGNWLLLVRQSILLGRLSDGILVGVIVG